MFGSLIDDTGFQLHTALEKIAADARGVVLYLRQREHSLDLVNQLRTYGVMQRREVGNEKRAWKQAMASIGLWRRRADTPRSGSASDTIANEPSPKSSGA